MKWLLMKLMTLRKLSTRMMAELKLMTSSEFKTIWGRSQSIRGKFFCVSCWQANAISLAWLGMVNKPYHPFFMVMPWRWSGLPSRNPAICCGFSVERCGTFVFWRWGMMIMIMILLAQDDAIHSKKYVDFSQKTPQLFAKDICMISWSLHYPATMGVQGTNMWIEQPTFWNWVR